MYKPVGFSKFMSIQLWLQSSLEHFYNVNGNLSGMGI